MSTVPIYNYLKAASPVTTIFGSHPNLRVYEFGQAPQNVARPYMVWQVITGYPNNNLSQLPDSDLRTIQIDVYAAGASTSGAAQALAGSKAIQDVVETLMNVVSWDGESRDPATNDYRVTFSVDWFINR